MTFTTNEGARFGVLQLDTAGDARHGGLCFPGKAFEDADEVEGGERGLDGFAAL